VRRAEVDEPIGRAFLHDLRVAARHVRILDLDVDVARAAEDGALVLEDPALAVPAEHGDLALYAELLDRRGLGRLRLRLVDQRRARCRALGYLHLAVPAV